MEETEAMMIPLSAPYLVESTGGLSVRIVPSRGLEIDGAWFAGVPLHWNGSATDAYTDDPWLSSFAQSMVTTCGLNNVGEPSEGYGLHGDLAMIPATQVTVRHEGDTTLVTGLIRDGAMECRRTITVIPSAGSLRIDDAVTNLGLERLQAPFLYHVNWGEPFLGPELAVEGEVESTVSRDGGEVATGWRAPFTAIAADELVLEHRVPADANGWRSLTFANTKVEIVARVSWLGLDRVHEWIATHRGAAVAAIEPANCSVLGRAHDREMGDAPYLEPDEVRRTSLLIEVRKA